MANYIELEYISPVSKFNFNNIDHEYLLVLINTTAINTFISKTIIKDINNIDDTVRGFPIGKAIKLSNEQNINYPSYKIGIFDNNKKAGTISLLFYGFLEVDKYEYGSKSRLFMRVPPSSKITQYSNDNSFIDERFYNFPVNTNENPPFCLLFFSKRRMVNIPILKQLSPDLKIEYNNYVFDRYSNILIKEFIPSDVKNQIFKLEKPSISTKHYLHNKYYNKKYCKNSKYVDFLKDYQVYRKTFDRPLKYDPYLNNTLVSPLDSRIRGFNINPTLKFNIGDKELQLHNIIKKPFELLKGSGYISRICPQDVQKVFAPYSGYLKEIKINGKNDSIPNLVTLRFESTYYIPVHVHERDYLSVLNGNYTHAGSGVGAGTRWWPELSNPQPNTNLIFYLVLIPYGNNSIIKFTNKKLTEIKKILSLGQNFRIKPMWIQQGEEICRFICGSNVGGGHMAIMLSNRPIDFTSDIKHFSKINNQDSKFKPFDTYIQARDLVGLLN